MEQPAPVLSILLVNRGLNHHHEYIMERVPKLINDIHGPIVILGGGAPNIVAYLEETNYSLPYSPVFPDVREQLEKQEPVVAQIGLGFYNNWHITLPPEHYICYLLSAIVFEYLYQKHRGHRFSVFRHNDSKSLNALAWGSRFPPITEPSWNILYGAPIGIDRLILDSLSRLRNTHDTLHVNIQQMARQVEKYIIVQGVPDSAAVYNGVYSIFIAAGLERAGAVTQRVNAGADDSLESVITLVESFPVPQATELAKWLKELVEKREKDSAGPSPKPSQPNETGPNAQKTTQAGTTIELRWHVEEEVGVTGPFGMRNDSIDGPDLLGYTQYAEAIADIITDDRTETPLTIAIASPWGRGKTKLLALINGEVGRRAKAPKRFECRWIDINAWELGKSNCIWAEFYSRLVSEMLKRPWYVRFWFNVKFAFKNTPWKSSLWALAIPVSVVGFCWLALAIWSADGEALVVTIVGGSLISAAGLALRFGGYAKRYAMRGLAVFSLPRRVGTEQEAISSISKVADFLVNESQSRFVIAVDDIDRCTTQQILSVMEAIRLFVNAKGAVFLLAMDTRVVMHAIGEHYRFMFRGIEKRKEMGREYLDKIIQVPFHLPPAEGDDLERLCRELMKPYVKTTPAKSTQQSSATPVDGTDDTKPGRNTGGPGPVTPPLQPPILNVPSAIAELSRSEEEAIATFPQVAGDVLSPRLLKRFVNVYMIARHLHMTSRGTPASPPASFTNWIGLSVLFPSEAKTLLLWMEHHQNTDPFDFDKGVLPRGPHPASGENIWEGFDPARVVRFADLFSMLQIWHNEIKDTRHITDCFNLALD